MEEIVVEVSRLFEVFKNSNEDRIEKLPQSGSDRIYFRIYAGNDTFIATFNLNIRENETFIYFSHHFKKAGLPMPRFLPLMTKKPFTCRKTWVPKAYWINWRNTVITIIPTVYTDKPCRSWQKFRYLAIKD